MNGTHDGSVQVAQCGNTGQSSVTVQSEDRSVTAMWNDLMNAERVPTRLSQATILTRVPVAEGHKNERGVEHRGHERPPGHDCEHNHRPGAVPTLCRLPPSTPRPSFGRADSTAMVIASGRILEESKEGQRQHLPWAPHVTARPLVREAGQRRTISLRP
jgi:hypothetical protein